jgi:hypothetical protein
MNIPHGMKWILEILFMYENQEVDLVIIRLQGMVQIKLYISL